jgi:hypothetical protein
MSVRQYSMSVGVSCLFARISEYIVCLYANPYVSDYPFMSYEYSLCLYEYPVGLYIFCTTTPRVPEICTLLTYFVHFGPHPDPIMEDRPDPDPT